MITDISCIIEPYIQDGLTISSEAIKYLERVDPQLKSAYHDARQGLELTSMNPARCSLHLALGAMRHPALRWNVLNWYHEALQKIRSVVDVSCSITPPYIREPTISPEATEYLISADSYLTRALVDIRQRKEPRSMNPARCSLHLALQAINGSTIKRDVLIWYRELLEEIRNVVDVTYTIAPQTRWYTMLLEQIDYSDKKLSRLKVL